MEIGAEQQNHFAELSYAQQLS